MYPLHFTVYLGHKEITALLLLHNVNIKVHTDNVNINVHTDNGHMPLYIAVENGRIDLANYLIEKGVGTTIRDLFSRTVFDAGDADVVG